MGYHLGCPVSSHMRAKAEKNVWRTYGVVIVLMSQHGSGGMIDDGHFDSENDQVYNDDHTFADNMYAPHPTRNTPTPA